MKNRAQGSQWVNMQWELFCKTGEGGQEAEDFEFLPEEYALD